MRKESIFTLLILVCNYITFSQESIDVNPEGNPITNLTAGELVRDVLIANDGIIFDPTTIIVAEDPQSIGDPQRRSWGYFTKAQSDFPFDEGIVLTTGIAVESEGPNDSFFNGAGLQSWIGDDDLKTILDNTNGDDFETFNATTFQFDFIPEGNTLVFDFIFASEEYERDYECSASVRDGFAFLIKGPGIPDDSGTVFGGSNIAAIPGSNNIVVNTGSIHVDTDAQGNPFRCGGEVLGVNFFPELYVSNSGTNNTNIMQFDGYTQILNTETIVVPGETYTIKFVIADRGDADLDSAVFIRGFSVKSNVVILDEDDSEANFSLCEGDSEILTATNVDDPFSGSETYEWQRDGVTIPGETSPTLTVTQSGTYKVIVTDLGIAIEDTIIVTVITPPNAGTSGEIILCSEDVAVDLFSILTDNPDAGGSWNPALQSGTGIFDPTADPAGVYTYTVSGDGSANCPDDSATVTTTVNITPTLTLDTTVCADNQLTYNVTFSTNGSWDITIDPPNAGVIDIPNTTITEIASGTDIIITAINPNNSNCEASLSVTSPDCDCPIIAVPTNPSNMSICSGETIPQLSVDVLTGQTANWYDDEGNLLISNSTTYTPTNNVAGNYIYSVEAVDIVSECVSDIVDVRFNIILIPEITLESSGSICVDSDGTPIDNGDFPVINTLLNDNEYSFVWSYNGVVIINETSSSITVENPGEYTVTYKDISSDCSGSSSIIIETATIPTALNLQLSMGAFAENNDIIATVTGDGDYEYILDNGDPQESNVFQNVGLGLHEVTAFDTNGCGSITEEIFVVGFPKFFTPNGDGFHDSWNVIADFDLPDMNIFIFDRHGKLLKQLNPNGSGWDGTYNGKILPSTEYWFKAELLDGSATYINHFALIR
ncbi:choice-of-anchor L domain-containing protein [Aquimarina sp. 2201CG5-10]|uniref:choice-of-anchor L domain-containing protein n=1 Tax=Aquimarina callyspongiae TaxID=3098150 RepID=UPI002AB3E126|nr:choice-of-anchor L domain-containing protein [Aquimarina sp. 2201CG5-10]MDY8136240.1 choice-of-anchor L domain-containing protein [Aquimarina sp. 2201CG5-10]